MKKIVKLEKKIENMNVKGQGSWECEHDCTDTMWVGNTSFAAGCSKWETQNCSWTCAW